MNIEIRKDDSSISFKNKFTNKVTQVLEKPTYIFLSGFVLGYCTNYLIKKGRKCITEKIINRFFKKDQ